MQKPEETLTTIDKKPTNYFNQHGCNGDQKSKEWRIGVQG